MTWGAVGCPRMPADTMGAASPRQASGQGLGRLQTSGLANTGARPHNQRGSVRDTSWARALIAVWIVGVCYGAYSVFGTNDKETAHVERRQRSNPAGGSMVGDAQFVAVKDFLMPPMRDGHRRPPGTGAGGGRVAETSRLSQQRWKKSALEKINSIREEAERPATNAAPVAALSQPRGLLKKAELDLQPLQHSPTGEFDPDSLPVHQCGYNNEPLKPWMNPADWNTSETRGGVDLHHPSKMSPILVMGCGHSGTTYLISCIGRHPTVHLRFSHELNKVGRSSAALTQCVLRGRSSGCPVSFLLIASATRSFFAHLCKPAASTDACWAVSLLILFLTVRDSIVGQETPICMSESHFTTQNLASRWEQDAQAKGKTHWAIKAPSNICCLGYIFKFVPNGRAIVVVRDGRDVLMSLAKRYSSIPDYPVDELMMRWVNDNLMALYYARDPRCLIVRYEGERGASPQHGRQSTAQRVGCFARRPPEGRGHGQRKSVARRASPPS